MFKTRPARISLVAVIGAAVLPMASQAQIPNLTAAQQTKLMNSVLNFADEAAAAQVAHDAVAKFDPDARLTAGSARMHAGEFLVDVSLANRPCTLTLSKHPSLTAAPAPGTAASQAADRWLIDSMICAKSQ